MRRERNAPDYRRLCQVGGFVMIQALAGVDLSTCARRSAVSALSCNLAGRGEGGGGVAANVLFGPSLDSLSATTDLTMQADSQDARLSLPLTLVVRWSSR